MEMKFTSKVGTFHEMTRFVKKVHTVFLATTDGRSASVRPMSAYAWFDGELWMATGLRSVKVRDVRKRAAIEVCAMADDYCHVRIEGTGRISTRPADKKRMFAAHKWMADFFNMPEDPTWAVLKIKPRRIRAMGSDLEYREVALA